MTADITPPAIGLLDLLQTTSADPEATVRFYHDVLGADVQTADATWSQVRLGGVDIGIHARPAGYEGWMPAFRVADIAALRTALQRAGSVIVDDLHDIPGGVTLHFSDPDGHALAVIQYGTSVAQLQP